MSRAPFVLAAIASLLFAQPVAAQVDIAGGVQGHFVASPDGEYGGGLTTDIGVALDVFRLGGYFGVLAVPSEIDVRNRVFMPLAVSLGIEVLEDVGFSARVRAGMWGGATQEVKLTAGGLLGGGLYFLAALGPGVGLSIGLDVLGLFGDGETVLFAPAVGLTWRPAPDDAPPPDAGAPGSDVGPAQTDSAAPAASPGSLDAPDAGTAPDTGTGTGGVGTGETGTGRVGTGETGTGRVGTGETGTGETGTVGTGTDETGAADSRPGDTGPGHPVDRDGDNGDPREDSW